MTLRNERYEFDDEVERLSERCKEIATQVAELEEGNPAIDRLISQGHQLDAQLSGVRWAREEWDVDGVTLGGLTGGEYGKVEDTLNSQSTNTRSPGEGAWRVYQVAQGTVTAPYISDEMGEEERIGACSELPVTYLKWASAQIDGKTKADGGDEGNANGFGDWLVDAHRRTTSTED